MEKKEKKIKFKFEFGQDTAEAIAKEMVDALALSKEFNDVSVESRISDELKRGIQKEKEKKKKLANSPKNLTNSGPSITTSTTANTVSNKITPGINTRTEKKQGEEEASVAKTNDRKKGESIKTTVAKSSKKEKTIISNDVALKSAPTPTPATPLKIPTTTTAKVRAGGTEKLPKKENKTPKRENKITTTPNTKNAQNARLRTNSCIEQSPKVKELNVDNLAAPTYPQSAPTTPTNGSSGLQKQDNLKDNTGLNAMNLAEIQRKRDEEKKAETKKAEAKKAEEAKKAQAKKDEDKKRKKKKQEAEAQEAMKRLAVSTDFQDFKVN